MEKVAVVTGGSGGIGHSICEMLIDSGYNVFFTYYSNENSAREVESKLFPIRNQRLLVRFRMLVMNLSKTIFQLTVVQFIMMIVFF